MELNRNHYFVVGIILLILGLQFRFVESYMLTEETSQFIAKRMDAQSASANPFSGLLSIPMPQSRRTISPPKWLGWSLISVGAILTLHSLAMRKPGG